MRIVTAVIRPEMLGNVRAALEGVGVTGMTISEASGFGRQKGQKQVYRGAAYTTNLVPKLKVEVLTDADAADAVVEAVLEAASTGSPGDGKIWVSRVEQVVRVSDRSVDRVAL